MEWTLRVVSPLFLTGALKTQPEFRAPSVRGQLRYWLRAIKGAATDRLSDIWTHESQVFGSTEVGQGVTIRLYGPPPKTGRVLMLPHREEERRRAPTPAILTNQKAILQLVTRPGQAIPSQAEEAVKVWAALGGLGKRSRRMFGAFDLTGRGDTAWLARPTGPAELAQQIRATLTSAVTVKSSLYTNGLPPFPTLHPRHSWVIVAQQGFDDPQEANIDLFRNLLRTNRFRAKEQTFGQAVGGRRASPLIAQVRLVGDQYYPVLTALRSRPDRRIDWDHLKTFMQAAIQHYKAETVWGGW